ncbi:phosphomannomutase domain protein [Mycobacterium xenopi 4042]|uniref:Phosphomannomutase domain protein n=1 Tax=Mycobacterium xenopi 4042 TaxID=1299334 RepID=X7YJ70_MYCXE|nr:phosphomannomutase domain protein [Mycobacterium xenopi 4042]
MRRAVEHARREIELIGGGQADADHVETLTGDAGGKGSCQRR